MKKHSRDSERQSGRAERPKPPTAEQRIIFGSYREKNGQSFVNANNTDYLINEIKKDIALPIEANSTVKALLRNERRSGKSHAILLRVLGPKLSLRDRISRLLQEATIPMEFSKGAISEADLYGPQINKLDLENRRDLTRLALCTIDGESAKDFDDAVFATKKGKNTEVIVAIADVSHYVKVGSALDEEAISRGTSVYYPGHCVPMLPEQLSNGLCSLKPQVKRLAVAVIFEIGPMGGVTKPRIEAAVIKSAARLTYEQVQSYYDQRANGSTSLAPKIATSLDHLRDAAHILRKARERRGAIDFDVMESAVALDELGEPLAIHPQDRLDSHRIIEDLMVATNEIVAEFFMKKALPCLYRVHEPPDQDKLANFFKTAHAFGVIDARAKIKAADFTQPKAIQKVMAHYQKSKYQETLNTLMLRSMMQARYCERNLMHFGLASKAYLHFTSPIRRYADLVVHRQLRYYLFEKKPQKKIPEHMMATIAETISQKEVRATELERKIDRLYAATFMESRVGNTFDALIVSVTEFGLFVRIVEHHVEGLVHIATISRSHVNYLADKMALVVSGSNVRYMVGDKVLVKLINVNIDRGHVDFEMVKTDDAQGKSDASRAAGPAGGSHGPSSRSRRKRRTRY